MVDKYVNKNITQKFYTWLIYEKACNVYIQTLLISLS